MTDVNSTDSEVVVFSLVPAVLAVSEVYSNSGVVDVLTVDSVLAKPEVDSGISGCLVETTPSNEVV